MDSKKASAEFTSSARRDWAPESMTNISVINAIKRYGTGNFMILRFCYTYKSIIFLKMVALRVPVKFIQPSIEVLNIRIDEPITLITDLLLAAICFYAFFQIRRLDCSGSGKRYFKYYFLILGLGAMTGGLLGHAFLYRIAEEWKLVSWILIIGSVTLMIHALLELARPYIKKGIVRIISRFNVLIFALVIFFTLWSMAFSPLKFYTIFGMVVVVGSLSYYIYHKTGNRGGLILIGAVGVGLLSAIIFSFQWGLSPWFNHNDISHVILSFSAFHMYKGAVLLMGSVIGS
jgi:hypothetical protein